MLRDAHSKFRVVLLRHTRISQPSLASWGKNPTDPSVVTDKHVRQFY